MLRIRVLGKLELEVDGTPKPAPPGRPARTLLGWLALHPGTHRRAVVAAALWPDVLDASARASLRTALSGLRQALGRAADEALVADRERVGLAAEPAVGVDLREFDARLDSGRPAEALEVAGGELLPDVDDDWAVRARDRHRERWGTAMAAVADTASAAGDVEAALIWSRRRVELDPFDEAAHRDLIVGLAAAGRQATALALYQRLAKRLRRELGVVPSAATRELVRAIRADSAATAVRVPVPPPLPPRLQPRRWRTPFVGRTEALGRLAAVWASIQRGGLGVAVIVGEPGIGKSRLAAHFAAEAHLAGAAVLAGGAEREAEPYQPLAEALGGSSVGGGSAAERSDRRAGRQRLHEALADGLARAAGGRPLLLVLDDIHWADTATLGFLRHLAARGADFPLFVLAASRPGPLPSEHAGVLRELDVTLVELAGLSLDETAALVVGRAGTAASDSDLYTLLRRTAGNPFLLEALLDAGPAALDGALPAAVADLVSARLEWLGPTVRRTLAAGALVGREFDVELAAAAAGLSADEAFAALDAAAGARLVVPRAHGAGRVAFVHALVQEALAQTQPPGERARVHARVVAALDARVRAGSDDALAAAARHAIAAVPIVSAEQAAHLAEAAGAAFVAAYAAGDAAELLERAASLLEERGEPPALRATVECGRGDALWAADRLDDARTAFEKAAVLARRAGDGGLVARAALGIAGPALTIQEVDRQRFDILHEALAGLPADELDLRARLQSRLVIELAYDADAGRRERLSSEAVEIARRSGDARTLAAALGARHVVLWGPDHTHERLRLADEMLGLARRAGDAPAELQARTWRIVDLDELGDGSAVAAELDAYATIAARSRLSAYAWYVPAWRCARAYVAGRVDEANRLRRRAVELGRRAGDANAELASLADSSLVLADNRPYPFDPEWLAERVRASPAAWAYRTMLIWMLAATGREADARRELEGQRAAGAPGSWPRDTNWLSATKELSEAVVLLGEHTVAAELEALLEPFRDRMVVAARGFVCYGSVSGALGRLAELANDSERACALYGEAIEVEQRAGALVWATHHRFRLGEALLASAQIDRGLALLAQVRREAPALGLPTLAQLAAERTAEPSGGR